MARVCMRPGCDRAAEARLSYDPIGCQVWLDVLAERPGRNQEICGLHAGRLTVPRGWMLCDRRDDEPALFVAAVQAPSAPVSVLPDPAPAPPSGRPGRRRRSEAARHPAATLELFAQSVETTEPAESTEPVEVVEVIEVEVGAEPAVAPIAAGEAEPEPASDEDEVPAMLRATSPLLARAFAATGHQRSVLTQRTDDRDDPSS